VFAVKDFQCRGCESFEQVEPFCGRPSPQAKSPTAFRPQFTTTLAIVSSIIRGMQQTMVDDV
jgi:hypothetical protein